ncbi:MAG: class I SAM-dependent methyltransferase [bacterium]|nr:class I SAM-dependent methyltransferase [bacterium]
MNFTSKAYLQIFFSALPNGEKINYLFQKHVTHSLPISDEDFIVKLSTVKMHYDIFYKYKPDSSPENCNYYEFGSGYDLVIPIGISLLGFNNLKCIDIRELVFPELINDTIRRLSKLQGKVNFEYILPDNIPIVTKSNFKNVLKEYFSIDYMAPLDARNTRLEMNSIDFMLSNATMEHIPQMHIRPILDECFRIMKPGGVMSNAIDYRDHWSFFDKNISCYNYLQYSPAQWNRLNPSIMYQNRMRHRDYIEIIKKTGFEIVEEIPDHCGENEFSQLQKIKLDPHYKNNYTPEELSIKSSMIVLRKN